MPTSTLPTLLTLEEAAVELRMTLRTLFARRRDGTIRERRIGGKIFIPSIEIARLSDPPPVDQAPDPGGV